MLSRKEILYNSALLSILPVFDHIKNGMIKNDHNLRDSAFFIAASILDRTGSEMPSPSNAVQSKAARHASSKSGAAAMRLALAINIFSI
ncbi:MAG: hypothetical protein M9918_13285 [Anaerolineae bacterium]|nr:hypothetical protein [Anaerolineae bacterium]